MLFSDGTATGIWRILCSLGCSSKASSSVSQIWEKDRWQKSDKETDTFSRGWLWYNLFPVASMWWNFFPQTVRLILLIYHESNSLFIQHQGKCILLFLSNNLVSCSIYTSLYLWYGTVQFKFSILDSQTCFLDSLILLGLSAMSTFMFLVWFYMFYFLQDEGIAPYLYVELDFKEVCYFVHLQYFVDNVVVHLYAILSFNKVQGV